MRLLHLSDLHLGKRVHGFSIEEEQADMLGQIVRFVQEQAIDAVLIAGDVYDRAVPSEAAMVLLDRFLNTLASRSVPVYMISGNHDSAIRLQYGAALFAHAGIQIASTLQETVQTTRLGDVELVMIPFLKPAMVRPLFPDRTIETYADAMDAVLSTFKLEPGCKHIALVHQFIAGSKTCDSEQKSIGGLDEIPAETFKDFDYVALGHLHSFQKPAANMAYCGTLLKYSADEIRQRKRFVVLDVGETIQMETHDFHPLRDLVEIKGTYMELTDRSFYETLDLSNYYSIVLLDDHDIVNAHAKLQTIYPKILKLTYANRPAPTGDCAPAAVEKLDPLTVIDAFYQSQNGRPVSEAQKRWIVGHWEESVCD
ncbi:exonuclease SbcCD subunit D [uncultured Dubosiella sp.]|uniref:exonuclease SbcCD subunit D n=1 Tax=uncultured Dubosiella sp. TaxID=1937011 RepID=UPI0025B45463|nr:exonuclease SbcCD subunit D [uncultured Dubosiella sp.]